MRISYFRLWACAAIVALLSCSAAQAAAINYGDSPVLPPGIKFRNVTESSGTDPVPLYGAPSYFNTGADFDPTSLIAFSTNGANDITDGQLNFTLEGTVSGSQVVAINNISLFEAGDYTLAGVGTAATQVIAGASIRVTITEIDGVAPAGGPITLIPSNASVGFNLLASPGIVMPWSLGTSLNIAAQLTSLGIPHTYGATEVEVVIDNDLIALSEAASAARIAKKDFQVMTEGEVTAVPEPAAVSVLALGVAGVLMRRRGR
jgi:hypothetical protein